MTAIVATLIRAVGERGFLRPRPLQKRDVADAETPSGFHGADALRLPQVAYGGEGGGALHRFASEVDASGLSGCDPLRLPGTDERAFGFGDVAEQLQHNIRDEGSSQVPAVPGVQERHIENHNGSVEGLGNVAPLVEDVGVVAPKAIDGLNHQDVARTEDAEERLPRRPLEVLTGLFIKEGFVALIAWITSSIFIQANSYP